MTDDNKQDTTGNGASNTEKEQKQPEINIVAQYIRDMSFECPNIDMLLAASGDKPDLNIKINVNAKKIGENIFESAIEFKAHAKNSDKVIYELELVYSGVFQIDNLPQDAVEVFLLVNCPNLLFPFMRRIVADLTGESGLPPLFLKPLDFAGLYRKRKMEEKQQAAQQTST